MSSRGASSSRGKEKAKPSEVSMVVAKEFASKVMQERHRLSRTHTRDMAYRDRGGPLPTETVVGGFVKSYRFVYTPGDSIVQGTMGIDDGCGTPAEYDVTIVILKQVEAQDGLGAQRIVDETKKLADYSDVIVEAHFSAYCDVIKRWIVVYDKFDGYFYEEVKERENPEENNEIKAKYKLFQDEGKTELTDPWRNTIRNFIQVLSFARVRNVFHGGLSRKGSYVVCSGVVKLIDVARRTGGQPPDTGIGGQPPDHVTSEQLRVARVTGDLRDLCQYFRDDPFLEATLSKEWISLDYLLKSDAMASDRWEDAALNHPILLSSATGKLTSYEVGEVFMWSHNTVAQRHVFSNALYCLLSDFKGKVLSDFFEDDPNSKIYKAKISKGSYNGPIYCDIIQYVRNLKLHPPVGWTEEFITKEIAKLFPGLLSMSYSLAKVPRAEWRKLFKVPADRPYK